MGSEGFECGRKDVGGEGNGDGSGGRDGRGRSGGQDYAGEQKREGGEEKAGDGGFGRYDKWVVGMVNCLGNRGSLAVMEVYYYSDIKNEL